MGQGLRKEGSNAPLDNGLFSADISISEKIFDLFIADRGLQMDQWNEKKFEAPAFSKKKFVSFVFNPKLQIV